MKITFLCHCFPQAIKGMFSHVWCAGFGVMRFNQQFLSFLMQFSKANLSKDRKNRQAERKETNRLYKLQDGSERPHREWQNVDKTTSSDCRLKHMDKLIRQMLLYVIITRNPMSGSNLA